jgi:lysophospholipase L1-like esterase
VVSLRAVRGTILVAIACLAAVLVAGSLAGPAGIGPPLAHADPAQVLIVGDSLAVGMRPFLGDMITDREVTFDAKDGRTTPQGLEALRLDLEQFAPQAVVINLGTNDGSDPHVFADRVRRTLRAVPLNACVVWPSIIRPKRKGAYKALNDVLRDAARHDRRMTVIGWDRMVAKGTVTLRDGIHPTPEGYRFRAWVTAAAVQRGCAGTFSAPQPR